MVELLILCIVFAAGYGLGRRKGWESGFAEAEATIPLRLRQESYEYGHCIFCQEKPAETACEDILPKKFMEV